MVKKEIVITAQPELISFPYKVLEFLPGQGWRIEVDLPDEEKAYNLEDLKKDVDKIKAKLGVI